MFSLPLLFPGVNLYETPPVDVKCMPFVIDSHTCGMIDDDAGRNAGATLSGKQVSEADDM